ncbi:MAG: hypothetical protein Q4F95_07495 [Oscillospiraceae bacterium]|nr:hypothetical protein [Oscillospiraceae bacterium]
MAKINIDGVTREMTSAEVEAMAAVETPEPTTEEVLVQQLTDVQLALCEIFEAMGG